MLYLAPHLVSMKDIPQGLEREADSKRKLISAPGVKRYVNMKEYSEIGVDGNPAVANREDGEQFYQAVLGELEKAVRALQDLAA